jgi:hypothetical protein
VGGKEQFRQIYKGRAHRCIITDLMSKTNYRFRLIPYYQEKGEGQVRKDGEWSETITVMTKDSLVFDTASLGTCGTHSLKDKLITFDKTGTASTLYGYSFGQHFWQISISLEEGLNLGNGDMSGIMVVGVINKKFNSTRNIGSVVNYTLTGG